jgi:Porin subfamily
MKMVKSLLLGSAAGLVAVTAGQAADLPVKAKPVEYVKICSLYGAGFYYMPGTDMCIKIGGFVRAEITDYSNGNMTAGPQQQDFNNRSTNNFTMRARGYITADAREQTAYGTARAYIAVGISTADTGATLAYSSQATNRAFIQWAGITAGQTQSFYDFYSAPAMGYRGYNPSSDTGDPGWWVWAYTAQLGNGVTASISAEERRTAQIIGFGNVPSGSSVITNGASLVSVTNTAGYGGMTSPDIVGNIRVDQTWGSAQVMAAAHNVDAPYYSSATVPFSGGPSDQWGFVVGAGLRLNFPMVAQGDYFQSQVNYTQGATRYVEFGNGSPSEGFENGNALAIGVMSDCVYGSTNAAGLGVPATNGTGCNLTTAWGVNAGYEHYWTPQFHESFFGSYDSFRYNSQANNSLCAFENEAGPVGSNGVATTGCNNNWNQWAVGTRFQYNVTSSLYIGVEFLYNEYDTATLNGTGTVGPALANGVAPVGVNAFGGGVLPTTPTRDEGNLSVTARIHKDFLP